MTSDSDSIADAWQAHHYVKSAAEASCAAVKTGYCDIDSGGTYVAGLAAGIAAGHCTMADVDRALFHTMKVRFELGLFDPPTGPYWQLGEDDIGTDKAKELNLESAMKSLVLIKNGAETTATTVAGSPTTASRRPDAAPAPAPAAVLPFKVGAAVAVIGPHGNATGNMIQVDTGSVKALRP